MLFNRQGLQQKNWRMVKKGKHILFGCSLFFVLGGASIGGTQVAHASETNSSEVIAKEGAGNNTTGEKPGDNTSALEKEKSVEGSNDKTIEKTTQNQDVEKSESNESTKNPLKKEVNKKELKDLVDKIKKTDISKKTEKSAEKLNLILSRAEKALDNKEITQEEIDKEVKALKEAFEKLEDKSKEDKKSEAKEKTESKKEEKSDLRKENSEKTQEDNKEDFARKHNEKITKVTTTVNEIHSIANQINYEFSESEKELVKTAEKLPTAYNSDKYNEETIQKLLKEVVYLRNKVANRMTRAHSGKRDPRNGQPINGNGESRFRAVYFLPTQNQHGRGEAGLVKENRTDLTYYNSDEIYSFMRVLGQRGPGEPLYRYEYGENRGKEDKTPYYLKSVGVISGLDKLKGITLRVAYINPRTGKEDFQDITSGLWNVNNPEVKAVIRGWLGRYDKTGEAVEPGDYRVTIAAGRRNPENSITYTFHVKAQSERNTVNDLATPTYVDDVRHLKEAEKTDLIKKFEAAHPGVVNRPVHVDYDHAEVSADGETMTIHFKDGFAPKTIQTNAQNDAIAKHQSITALYGDPQDFYKNSRNLVKSKTGNELPSTVDVTWKTPFNLQQPGTRNAVVTVTYQNGVSRDVSTSYTVLDFIGKQDKRINQHQSGELGDARSYITLSNGTAAPTDLTIRWKGGSTVDTSRPTIHRKQIEILRGNTVMKTVDIPVEIVDNIRPTVEIPYDNPGNQEIYVYSHENNNITLKAKDNNGKVSKVYLAFAADNRQGLGQEDSSYLGGGSPDGLYLTATKIKSETTGSDAQPATITVSGNINNQPFTGEKSITRYLYTEDPAGNTNYEHVGHANDTGAPGRVRFVWKPQTFKYTATANSQTQTVSYKEEPSAEASVNKTGLPAGTTYAWKTKPDTSSPGNKSGVVEVTYPDTSKDTVNVTVAVRKLSDEYAPTGNKIVRNQNTPVTNNDLKAAVTISNNGNSKVKSVTPVGTISTTNAGTSTIKATVTYLDDTTDPVDIPLEVKDVTAPTIQTPSDRQNWDLIALDRTLPSITVTSVDNNGGTGVKSTTVTGLPDFLVYDNATKTIKFKNGVQEVTKLPVGQDSKTYTATIQVTDNADNPSQRQFMITVKSMTTKYNATPNEQKQTVSYGATPDAGTSINKNGLPAGTTYTWATTPSTTTGPGDKAGVVTVTYPDGSKDTVNVTVNVRRLADEYAPTATKITKNQNESVSNNELKAAVTISNNGNSKVKSVTPVGTISTTNAGTSTIKATVTYLDDTTDPVDIPLEVKDVTAPTIQTPSDRQNWDLIALDRTLPSITVTSVDNNGGTGVKSTTVTGLPDFLAYDNATKTIKFKNGVQEVTKLPEGTDVQTHNITITVTDNANNPSQRQFTITVKSMTTKYDATANSEKQTVSYGATPDAGTSINKNGLPAGTTYTWATTPSTTTGPGEKAGVVTVTYPDGSKDTVNVTVNVRALNDEYKLAATEIVVNQNDQVSNDKLKTVVSATSKVGNVNGTDKISSVVPKSTISTANYGNQIISATVTFKDGTVKDVSIPLKVEDVTKPTITAPAENTNWELTALDKVLPNMEVRAEDNANGSGIKSVSITGLPDYLEYDKTTNSIKFKAGKQEVEKLSVNTPSREFTLTIRAEDNAGNISEKTAKITVSSMSTKYAPQPKVQTVDNGAVPEARNSIGNVDSLPPKTTFEWKNGAPNTAVDHPGEVDGTVVVHYPDGTSEEVAVKVNVKGQADTYAPQPKVQTVDNGAVPEARNSIGNVDSLPPKTTFEWKNGAPNTAVDHPGEVDGTVVVHYPDGTSEEVAVKVNVKGQADTYAPQPKVQTVDNGAVPEARNSIGNVDSLPPKTTFEWKNGAPNTAVDHPGEVDGTVVVHYPDGTSEEVAVKVNVKGQADTYAPQPKVQTVDNGAVPEARNSIGNVDSLPPKTTFEWKNGAPNTAVDHPGEVDGTVVVHYPDGTSEEVAVKVNVKGQADTYAPQPKVQTVDNGAVPEARNSIGNVDSLPPKTTFEWKNGAPNTAVDHPGEVDGTVVVHYPDGTSEEVAVKVNVKGQADTYAPQPKVQTVDNGAVPEARNSIGNVDSLPPKTTFEWKNGAPNTAVDHPGEVDGTVVVHYPDGTSEEVAVKVNVKGQADTYAPQPKVQTVDNGAVPEARNSIGNVDSLPPKTTFEWKNGAPNTAVDHPGEVDGTVVVHYPDGTSEEVAVKVNVKGQADTYAPQPKVQTVDNGAVPEARNSIGNVDSLPPKTTFEWKNGAPNTAVDHPGEVDGTVVVHYPDGTSEEVAVKVNVKGQADTYAPQPKVQTVDNGAVPEARNSIGNVDSLPPKTTFEWKNGAPNTAVDHPGEVDGTVVVHYPDGTSEEVAVKVNVKGQADTYAPQPKVQTVDNGAVPEARNSIGNVDSLPPKTTFEWKNGAPNTAVDHPGEVDGTVVVHYPDGTSEEVAVKVNVKGQADTYAPQPKVQTVDNGAVPEARNSIGNVDSLPPKTTFEWKNGAPNTAVDHPGEVDGTVVVHYPDGTSEEVAVKVNVKGQADTYAPQPKVQTVDNGAVPEARNSIGNVDSLPPKTTFEWKNGAPNTAVDHPGEVDGTVVVHYPDGTSEEVAVKVNVKGQADTYAPQPKVQTVDNGAVPEARNSIGNVDSLPPKTTFEWKNGAPNTAVDHPGEVDGTVVVHYPDGTSEEVAVKVNVKGQADTYAPQPKVQTVDNGAVPEARNSIGNVDSLPPKTTFEWKNGAPNTAVDHPGEVDGTVVVHYPDGTSEEVAVKVNVKGQADTYAPQPKVQTVDNGAVPEARNSIGNVDSLPPKTTFEWKNGAPNTAVDHPGEVDGTVVVHYPDGTSEEVAVKVNVKGQADTYAPQPKVQTVDNGAVPEARNSIGNVDSLPPKTTFEWKNGAPNTAVDHPGEVDGTVVVHYPDGTSEEVAVKVNVKGQADTYAPQPKVQTVDNGAVPEARNSIGNVDSLPPKTTFEWKNGAPNTAVDHPGEVDGTVVVHYPDGTSEEVAVKVNVKGQADTYAPQPKVQTVDNGAVPEARNSIGNVDSLPPKTTFEWKNGAPNTAVDHPGEVDGTVVVHYPDGTSEEVAVKVNVKGQADTYAPQPKVQTVDNGAVPEARNSIGNVDSLPPKTTFEWKNGAPNTAVDHPGEVDGTVVVHYPDGTSEEVAVKVNVKGQADTYAPQPKVQTVDNGAVPEARNSIGNVDSLPPKTTFEWKNGAPNTAVDHPGEVDGTVVVHYPDGTSEEVAVKVNVKGQADTYAPQPKVQTVDNGAVPEARNSIGNVDSLPPKTTFEWKNGAPNTAVDHPGEVDGTVVVHYPDGTSEEVAVKVNVKGQADTYAPQPKVQTVDNGAVPEARNSIGNVDSLPPKTTFEWKNGAPNTAVDHPGEVDGTVVVHYPDGTSEEVAVKVNVKGQADTYAPQPKVQTVDNGAVPEARNSIGNVDSLPPKTTFEWKNGAPNTAVDHPGEVDGTVVVHYPDGTSEEVAVKVNVKGQADTYAPQPKVQTVDNGAVPEARNSIGNVDSLPPKTTFEWKNGAPNTAVDHPGEVDGTVVVHYPDGTSEEVAVKVNVKGQADTYAPQPKVQTVDNGAVPEARNSIGNVDSLPPKTTFEWKNGAPNTAVDHPGEVDGTVVVHYPDGTSEEVAVKVNVKGQADTYAPQPKVQTVDNGAVPEARNSIGNVDSLPPKTTFEWKNGAPNTAVDHPGEVDGTVVVHYPDGTSEEVAVKVNVKGQADTYAPQPKVQTVDNGAVPEARNSIGNVDSLPPKTTFEWKNGAPNTAVDHPGEVDGTVVVHYPDGTSEEVAVKVNVKGQADTYAPQPKVQTVDNGAVPEARNSIGNVDSLPPKTTFEWKNGAPNTAVDHPGEVDGTVVVHYPDGTSEEVAVKVNVKGQADTYAPQPKVQTVDNGAVPEARNSIGNVDSLPPKTTFEWKNGAPNTAVDHPGEVDGTVVVHYPDGTSEEVAVKVNVKGQADTYAPQPKVQTVDNGAVPEARNSIGNVDSLPPKTTFEWKNGAPNTAVDHPGEVDGTVVVHYPDGTSEEVAVKVNVKGQADTYAPQPKVQTVDNGAVPEARNSIGNVDSLPPKTTFEWKNGAPNTAVDHPGEVDGTVVVHYPDGTSEEVAVKVNVKGQADTYAPQPKVQTVDNGAVPEARNSIGNVDSLPPKTTFEWKNGAPNTAVDHPGEVDGTVVVHYPDGTSEEVPVTIVVRQSSEKGVPETNDEKPEFSGGVNPSDSPSLDIPEYTDPIGTSGTDGNGNTIEPPKVDIPEYTDPIGTSGTDGNGNTIEPPRVDIPEYTGPIGTSGTDGNGNTIEPPIVNLPEFSGGVNGELPEPTQLPKIKLIITKWIDENGNELKPADAKYPKVLGELNEAFDHGEIKGYVFVRTEVDNSGEVVTHIFRKVSNIVITSSNRVEESTKFNKTLKAPKRLANTGQSQNNSELAGLGLAIVGLFAAIKRRKNEEE